MVEYGLASGLLSMTSSITSTSRNPRRTIRGQGMVEFALLIPVLLMLIVGSMEIARLMFIYAGISSAARQAARYGSVNGDRDPATAGTQQYMLDCAGIRQVARNTAFLQGITDTNIYVGYDHGALPAFATCVQDSQPSPALQNGDRIVISITTVYSMAIQ